MGKRNIVTLCCALLLHIVPHTQWQIKFAKGLIVNIVLFVLSLGMIQSLSATTTADLLTNGWSALVEDKEMLAIECFQQAQRQAHASNDLPSEALALLNLGICYHGSSYTKGLSYCNQALVAYQRIENSHPEIAKQGRARCLQLMSTLYARQGKLRESISLSKQALEVFLPETDTMGYIGLIYNSLGTAYTKTKQTDSAEYCFRQSLAAQLNAKNVAFLPAAYQKVGDLALHKGNFEESHRLYLRAQTIADSTHNQQAQVSTLLSMGKWVLQAQKDEQKAETYFQKARNIAQTLSDKSFYVSALQSLLSLRKKQGNFEQAFAYLTEIQAMRDSLHQWETQNIVKRLEMEFETAEKDRKMAAIQKEQAVSRLINYVLWGSLLLLICIAGGYFVFLKKIHKKDKALLQSQAELMQANEAKKQIEQQYLQNELAFKESQLSAMTLQMVQKNELLQTLNAQIAGEKNNENLQSLQKTIQKGWNQDKEWADFALHFESINKNFYQRLKAAYPDITPHEMKVCVLIKMNLSIKEMASILNISPDSVKTARYRLRKKLQLNTEDNLTDFIQSLT